MSLRVSIPSSQAAPPRANPLSASRATAWTSGSPALVHGDPDALSTAIRNLVDNAIRYTPRGGRVQVAVSQSAGEVQVSVEDSGPGVPEKDRETIFSPLRRGPSDSADRNPEGHGLGLAIARRIVERHQGGLSVKDANGRGARFVIRIPATGTSQSSD